MIKSPVAIRHHPDIVRKNHCHTLHRLQISFRILVFVAVDPFACLLLADLDRLVT